uniref:Glycosyltransferase family 92 protein n=1 Tax=Steinernema glaseri TaxID=37863 RepID=A0A1I8AEH0_9BILA
MTFRRPISTSFSSVANETFSKVKAGHFLFFSFIFVLFYCIALDPNDGLSVDVLQQVRNNSKSVSADNSSTVLNASTEIGHLFLTMPIYCDGPKSFPRTTMAVVAAAARRFRASSILCISYSKGHKRTTRGSIQTITYTPFCKWSTYLVLCPVQTNIDFFGLATKRNETPLMLNFTRSDPVRRSVVVCMSRMFLYENWQILLTTLEIYRYYKVDLLVAYIDSIVTGAFELLKVYEKEGLVMIEPSVKIYYDEGRMSFNPNDESEWGNQMIVYNHCMYRFRESAEFVVFADWDDVLVPRGSAGGMADSLRALFEANAYAGAFQLHRRSTTVFAASDSKRFDLMTTLTTMDVSEFFGPGKTVVIPNRVKGAWVHKPRLYENGYRLDYAKTHQSWFYHLRVLSTYGGDLPKEAKWRPNELNATGIVEQFNEFYKEKNLGQIFAKFPKRHTYLNEMEKCYRNIAHLFHLNNRDHCPNQGYCEIPELSIDCVNVEHGFARRRMDSSMIISYGTNARFVFSKTGCIP